MVEFVKGKKLSELFFKEVVKPILDENFSGLKYSAGLLGCGSDVLGLDTAMSMDHDWGPRVLLFLSEQDYGKKKEISEVFSNKLPYFFRGFSTNFCLPDEKGVKVSKKISKGKINHRIEIYTVESFFKDYLNIGKNITVYDWFVFSEQKLLTLALGKVFHDDLDLKNVLKKFNYYPEDVWLYFLASQWTRIAQEEPFMGRCGELKDGIGSKLIAARLVKDIMKMCFLMEKQYTPYIKWFGTVFNNLKSAKKLKPILELVLKADDWKIREKHLVKAYEHLAKLHNALKITTSLKIKAEFFHDRPFLVINGARFASEIKKQIKDPVVKKINLNIGSINQFSDSTDVLENNTQKFKQIYE